MFKINFHSPMRKLSNFIFLLIFQSRKYTTFLRRIQSHLKNTIIHIVQRVSQYSFLWYNLDKWEIM